MSNNNENIRGKIAVIKGGSSDMALASAKRFVEEGAYVFIEAAAQDSLGYCRRPLKGES